MGFELRSIPCPWWGFLRRLDPLACRSGRLWRHVSSLRCSCSLGVTVGSYRQPLSEGITFALSDPVAMHLLPFGPCVSCLCFLPHARSKAMALVESCTPCRPCPCPCHWGSGQLRGRSCGRVAVRPLPPRGWEGESGPRLPRVLSDAEDAGWRGFVPPGRALLAAGRSARER